MNTNRKHHNQRLGLLTALACLLLIIPVTNSSGATGSSHRDNYDLIIDMVRGVQKLSLDDDKHLIDMEIKPFEEMVMKAFKLDDVSLVAHNNVGTSRLQEENKSYANKLQKALMLLLEVGALEEAEEEKDEEAEKVAEEDPEKKTIPIDKVSVTMTLRGLEALRRGIDRQYHLHQGPIWKFRSVREACGRLHLQWAWWPVKMDEDVLAMRYAAIMDQLRLHIELSKQNVEQASTYHLREKRLKAIAAFLMRDAKALCEGAGLDDDDDEDIKKKLCYKMIEERAAHYIANLPLKDTDEANTHKKVASSSATKKLAWIVFIVAGLASLEYKFAFLGLFASDEDHGHEDPFDEFDDEEFDDDEG
jgi:hypothetical protein